MEKKTETQNQTQNVHKDVLALKNTSGVFKELVTAKEPSNEPAIKIENLSFSVGKRLLLNKLNFEVKAGEIHGFLGPNGAGKTTTIKNIIDAYATRSAESKIEIFGKDHSTVEAKKMISYIPEYAAFPQHLSLIEYQITMARFSGFKGDKAKEKANKLINILELQAHKDINPNNFSSGMKKKVLLAQSLMNDPKLLILDEPAANLDPAARNLLFGSLKEVSKMGITIFISSHILAEIEHLVDSITLINLGNIVYSGKVETIAKRMQGDSHTIKIYGTKLEDIEKYSTKNLEIKEEVGYVSIATSDNSDLYKLVEKLAKNQVAMDKIEFDKVSLQEIYNKEFGV